MACAGHRIDSVWLNLVDQGRNLASEVYLAFAIESDRDLDRPSPFDYSVVVFGTSPESASEVDSAISDRKHSAPIHSSPAFELARAPGI